MKTLPPMMLWITGILLIFLSGSGALTTEIIEPIRSSGDEVGLIVIPGLFIQAEKYYETAQAIQEASELRLWVALAGNFFLSVADPQQVKEAVEYGIQQLEKAGMTSKNYVGVGHGMSGHFLQAYAKESPLKAIVLMGSCLPRDTKLRDFPIPVLTLSGELDGVTRITRIADEFEKLTEDTAWGMFQGLCTAPVIFIEGANHAQFASGEMPPYIRDKDLASNETDEVVYGRIGKHVNDFLTVNFGSQDSQTSKAREHLAEAFLKSSKKFKPFLDIKHLDTDGSESMWTIIAQEHFAGELSNQAAIYNDIENQLGFFGRRPKITSLGESVIIGTVALVVVEQKTNVMQYQASKESSREIDMKLISKDAIQKALDKPDTSLQSEPNTCKSLNRLALALAVTHSDEKSRERYLDRGRPIIFEEDSMIWTNFLWAASPLQMWEDSSGLHVQSPAMVTSTTSMFNPGVHYCKVISPYRAMEWLNVESLREYRG